MASTYLLFFSSLLFFGVSIFPPFFFTINCVQETTTKWNVLCSFVTLLDKKKPRLEGWQEKGSDDSFNNPPPISYCISLLVRSPHQVLHVFTSSSQCVPHHVPITFLLAMQFSLYFTICFPPPPSSPCVHIKFPTCSQCVPITFACTGILIVCHCLFPIKFSVCSHQVPTVFPPCSHNLCLHWNSYCISLFVPPIKFSTCSSSSQCVPHHVPITFACTGILIVFHYLFPIKFPMCSHHVPITLLIFNKLIKCILFFWY
jgi:hypothetical protein